MPIVTERNTSVSGVLFWKLFSFLETSSLIGKKMHVIEIAFHLYINILILTRRL